MNEGAAEVVESAMRMLEMNDQVMNSNKAKDSKTFNLILI